MIQERLKRFALRFLPERLLLGLKKIHYIRALRHATEDREPDLKIVRYLVSPGNTVIDIGANFGLYTSGLASMVGREGKVYSIEPVPQTYELLASNLTKLKLNNVEGFNVAISSEDGVACMEVPHYSAGGENFYEARIVSNPNNPDCRTVQVPAKTLDSLFAHLPKIDFIKCDVEGHELACLDGAEKILTTFQPAWLIEVSGNPDTKGSSANRLFSRLTGMGYQAYWFDGNCMHLRERGTRSVNYFFLMPHQVERIPEEYFESHIFSELRHAA